MAFFGASGKAAPRLTRYRAGATRVARFTLERAHWLAVNAPPTIAWAMTAVFLGIVVGFSAVILPPTGAFIIPALAFLVVLWAMPDIESVPRETVRKLFFIVLVVDLCVPTYYAIAGTGLPWISLRRLVTFPLVLAFALVVAGSSTDRARLAERLGAAKSISICAIGFLVMVLLSLLTSQGLPAVYRQPLTPF